MPTAKKGFSNCSIGCTVERANRAWFAERPSSELSSPVEAVIIAVAVKSKPFLNGYSVENTEGSYTAHMGDYSIGVDLGGTNLRIAAVDSDGKLLEKLTLGAEVSRGRDFVITEMCNAIETLRTKYRDSGELVGIGIGVPGFIDMAAGMVMQSPNLPDWTSFPVRDEIEKRLGTKVILENDANSAAMGEKWLGAAANSSTWRCTRWEPASAAA